jgi:TRAP-type C4-dicarboxylate transport system permease small subunit
MACVAGVIPLFILVAVIIEVFTRNAGLQPLVWTQAYAELSLLFCTMLVAPWLVRAKGHVFIDSFVSMLPALPRRIAEKLVYVVCIIASLVICYFSFNRFIGYLMSGEFQARSVDIPFWVVFLPLPPAFLLIAVEFARYLFGKTSMYSSSEPSTDGV